MPRILTTSEMLEQARHARERGTILRTLKEDYTREMTSTHTLLRVIDAQGFPLSHEDLSFHLRLMAEQGYVSIWRTRDLPGYRRDRPLQIAPDTIMFTKLSARGLQLMDGLIPEDPSVAF